MKSYYLCIGVSNVLYSLESGSEPEQNVYKLVKKGWSIDNRQYGKWYKIELFKNIELKNNHYCIGRNDLYELLQNIKNMEYIGEVKDLGYKDDGEQIEIVPLYFFICKDVN